MYRSAFVIAISFSRIKLNASKVMELHADVMFFMKNGQFHGTRQLPQNRELGFPSFMMNSIISAYSAVE